MVEIKRRRIGREKVDGGRRGEEGRTGEVRVRLEEKEG